MVNEEGFPWPWGYTKIDGLFHGKSQSKMDDLGLLP
jgi:hypothetical protein